MPRLNSPTFKGKVQGRTYLAGRGETQIKASPPTDIIFPPSSLALIVNFLCCAAWRGGKVFYELQPFWAEEQRKRRKGAAFAIKSSIRLLGRGDDNPFGLPIWDGGGRAPHTLHRFLFFRTHSVPISNVQEGRGRGMGEVEKSVSI